MTGNDLIRNKKRRALTLLQENRLLEARDLLEAVSRTHRDDMETRIFLAQINARLGLPADVERHCREIIRMQPRSPDAHYHLGCALAIQHRRAEAEPIFRQALSLRPDHAPTHLQLGHLSKGLAGALEHYRRAAELDPSLAEVHIALGVAQISGGQAQDGIASLRRALHLNSSMHQAHSSILFALNYDYADRDSEVFEEHVRWGKNFGLARRPASATVPDPDRQLRVGYVSPDLREHSVAYFFEPLLANHSGREVETFCYAEVPRPDAVTHRLQGLSGNWLTTTGISDEALVQRIQADRIDILVDLAGHSAFNRLRVFSAKPAPVQITWLGYPNTTGLKAMDYRFTDCWADPPGTSEALHTEELVRLPHGFLCYLPPPDAPAVSPPPMLARGKVTFGSYNNLPKIVPEVVALWSTLLHACPDANLVLKNFSLSDADIRQNYLEQFAAHGIDAGRLVLRGRHDSVSEHLDSYGEIDIALDTFPYNGTTTTCEALWMGVPVVTIYGTRHAGRVGASLLHQISLPELVASSAEEYVRITTRLASDRSTLAELRASLRQRMSRSALCDAPRFARDVEDTYRVLWRRWCNSRTQGRN